MKDNSLGERLIQELLANSTRFHQCGKAYELLQEYFNGLSLDTLRPLLANNNRMVRRAALWVTSELGVGGRSLIHDVIPLLNDDDRYVQYHVLEIIMVCSFAENVDEFVHVVRSLE